MQLVEREENNEACRIVKSDLEETKKNFDDSIKDTKASNSTAEEDEE